MEIDFSSNIKGCLKFKKIYQKITNTTLETLNIESNPIISVSIVDNDFIHSLNKKYRNVDKETDVISFAFLDNENNSNIFTKDALIVLGDIYISYEKAKSQAIEFGHSLEREMSFLFVHGLLHLLGYDHQNKEDETKMFELQEKILLKEKILR